ncbi:hypothetical protein [Rhodohalobacter sp.]|nr:hypothetical protein [Rhodohalobacter sp.]MDZ7756449.1 hypothetical protein [Rhodohalobacter sp.]
MARLLIMGAGVSEHTAALHAYGKLKRDNEVVVVSPNLVTIRLHLIL